LVSNANSNCVTKGKFNSPRMYRSFYTIPSRDESTIKSLLISFKA
jgi:hypothetical protein